MSQQNKSSAPILGILVLVGVISFFLLLPFYLGPNDTARCEKPDATAMNEKCHPADAIVALSGGDTAARTHEAIQLYKLGWADTLIFSGAAQDKSGPSNAEAMKSIALRAGIDPAAILTEEASVNTEENAKNTQTLVRNNNLHRIILVTSAYHQRRASLEFNKRAGGQVIVVNHPVQHDKQWTDKWYATPAGWWLALGELAKIIGFYVNEF